MNKRKFFALLLLAGLLSLSACGAATDSLTGAAGEANVSYPEPSSAAEVPMFEPADGVASEADFGAFGGTYYENTKIIHTANLSLQTTEFDAAVAALNTLVNAQEGFYESSDFTYGGYYSGTSRCGNFTVRVPQENYNAFLTALGDVAHVVSQSTGTENVGEAYYDAQLHLSTLNTKHDRLLALLEKAELMEDIIALESALSDVEYQIQQYTSTLTRYDGLIDFSTIHISLQEVVRVTQTSTEADPLSVRVGAAFSRGWHNFCDGAADFAVWLAYHFMGVLIFLALLAAVILVLLRLRRLRSARPAKPPHDKNGE